MESPKTGIRPVWIAALIFGGMFSLVSWISQGKLPDELPSYSLLLSTTHFQDTLPPKSRERIHEEGIEEHNTFREWELERALEDIENARVTIEKQLREKDWYKIQDQMRMAQKKMELEQLELKRHALTRADEVREMQRMIERRVHEDMDPEVYEKLLRAKEMAERSVDARELERQFEKANSHLRMSQEKMRMQMGNMEKELQKARMELDRSHGELSNLKELINQLTKDGLIRKGKPYELKIEKGELYIDGKKQHPTTRDKYKNQMKFKSLFEKDKTFTIVSDGNEDKEWI